MEDLHILELLVVISIILAVAKASGLVAVRLGQPAVLGELTAGVIEQNRAGFILTGDDLTRDGRRPKGWTLKRDPFLLETSVPGIFAAGDVRQNAVRRVASAVGQGSMAIGFVHQYLKSV